MKEYVKVDPDILELIPRFLEKKKNEVDIIEKAFQSGDFLTLEKMGHDLKGTGPSYGFLKLFELGELLEMHAKTKDHDILKNAISRLRDYLHHSEFEIIAEDQ